MSNGDFQKGTWNELPSNCTRSVTLTWSRCAEYGLVFFTECLTSTVTTEVQCVQWVWQTTKNCSWWSWLFCVLWAIVVTLVCVAFGIVTSIVCTLLTVVEAVVCILWTLISIIFCLSEANGGTAFLLTDGTVMMQEYKSFWESTTGLTWATRRWWKLTPDQFGSYRNGSWSRLADSNLGRAGFASAVLADGRVVVCGGEYSDASGTYKDDENNSCEIYDPVANTWSVFASPTNPGSPPVVWSEIGDASCTLLPDGTLLMGSIANSSVAKLDPATLTWTSMTPRHGVPSSAEDSWVLMPDNTVVAPSCTSSPSTWVYDIEANQWNKGNALPEPIVAFVEIGPGVLRYDGTAFFLGGNEHTAIYTPGASLAWSNGGDLPAQNGQSVGIMDGPAALLVNGNVLFGAGPTNAQGDYLAPSMFFEFDGTTFNRTNDPSNNDCETEFTRLLLLPDGDVLFCTQIDSSFYAYHSDTATPQDSFRPVIQTCPTSIQPGSTIQVSGLQFNGLSQATAYGDDSQTATNYPLVRILNKQTNRVRYCRTFNHTTVDKNGNTVPSMGVATGTAVITTNVEVPGDIDTGDSSLFVVANGIPSEAFDVAIWPVLV
jgi:hypothetical protein